MLSPCSPNKICPLRTEVGITLSFPLTQGGEQANAHAEWLINPCKRRLSLGNLLW